MAKSSSMTGMIDTVGEWYAKLPNLPKGGREFLVTITPWVALIAGGILVILGVLALIGSTAAAPFMALGGVNPGGGIIGSVLGLASGALLLAAYPGTKNHKVAGWNFLFYSGVVSLVSAVVLTFTYGLNLEGILGSLIGFYILYQIRSYYK